jgi:hypothetical protein
VAQPDSRLNAVPAARRKAVFLVFMGIPSEKVSCNYTLHVSN